MEQGSLPERYLSRSVIKHIRRLNPKLSVSAAVGNDYANLHGSVSADIKFEDEYRLPDKTARAVSYKECGELIRDVEIKYPQKKKVISPTEFEIVEEDEDFEDEPPKKKTNVKTNRS